MTRRLAVAFLGVGAITAVVTGYYYNRFWWPPDEGAYAHIADRLLQGEVLNRDIQGIHPGYINFANALWFRLFGDDLVSLRYPLVAMSVLQSCLVFLLLIPRGTLAAITASLSLTALSLVQFLNPTAHWYCLLLFIVLICCLSWLPRDGPWRLEIVGFLVVTLFLFRQLTGVIVAIGVLTFLLCEAPRGAAGKQRFLARTLVAVMAGGLATYMVTKTGLLAVAVYGIWPLSILVWAWFSAAVSNRDVLRISLRASLGGAVAITPLVVYHVLHNSVSDWLYDTLVSGVAFTRLEFFQTIDYPTLLLLGLRQVILFEGAAGVLNGLFWCILTVLAPVLGALFLRRLVHGEKLGGGFHPLPFLAVFYVIVSLHYQIPIYLFYSVGVTLVALLWMMPTLSSWRKYGTVTLALGLSVLGLFYQAGQPLSRGYPGLLAGERVALVESRGLDRCTLWMEAADVQLYKRLVKLAERETSPDETILAIPFNPELYFLTRRKNPFRFCNSALGIQNDDDLKRVMEKLKSQPPKLVFYRSDNKYNTPLSSEVMKFVKNRYKLLETLSGFEVYRLSGAWENP